jgi:hypothetical protein
VPEVLTIGAWFPGDPLWWAGGLLAGGAALLVWPTVRRWRGRRRVTPVAPASLEQRERIIAAHARECDRLERLLEEARRVIDEGVARLEDRLARLEAIERGAGGAEDRGMAPSVEPRVQVRAVKPATGAREEDVPGEPALAREVYALADQGRTPVQIAGALQEQVGKVELLLALRRAG